MNHAAKISKICRRHRTMEVPNMRDLESASWLLPAQEGMERNNVAVPVVPHRREHKNKRQDTARRRPRPLNASGPCERAGEVPRARSQGQPKACAWDRNCCSCDTECCRKEWRDMPTSRVCGMWATAQGHGAPLRLYKAARSAMAVLPMSREGTPQDVGLWAWVVEFKRTEAAR